MSWFPEVADDGATPARRRRPTASPPPVVLLAEDDDELRRLLAHKLERRGCVVVQARTGVELAALIIDRGLERAPADLGAAELIVTDVRMPGMTGLEIVGLLRMIDWALPVIVMTGFGDAAAHAEARRLGAQLFDKPVDLDVLTAAACAALGLPAPT